MPKCIKCNNDLTLHWHTKLISTHPDGTEIYEAFGTSLFCNNLKYRPTPSIPSFMVEKGYAYEPCPLYGLLQIGRTDE